MPRIATVAASHANGCGSIALPLLCGKRILGVRNGAGFPAPSEDRPRRGPLKAVMWRTDRRKMGAERLSYLK